MATFSKVTFNAASYASARPTYPRALFDHVFRFHAGGSDLAIDLGCGTGQATLALASRFSKIVGVDPSAGMVDAARRTLASNLESEPESAQVDVAYVQSPAEDLPFLAGSVDMIIAAQAGHWFDWTRMWPEAARVLRKDGTVAIWNYSEFRLPRYPTLTPLLTDFFQGTDPQTSIGSYWQQPGRSILNEHLVRVPDPRGLVPGVFSECLRVYYTGGYYPHLPNPRPILMRARTTWSALYAYVRTSSALHTFLERNPGDAAREGGDVAERFWRAVVKGAEEARAQEGEGATKMAKEEEEEEEVEVEWPLALILARRA